MSNGLNDNTRKSLPEWDISYVANSFESTPNVSSEASRHDSDISILMEYTFTPCSSRDQEVRLKISKNLDQLFMNAYVHKKKKSINPPDTTEMQYSPRITMDSDLPSLSGSDHSHKDSETDISLPSLDADLPRNKVILADTTEKFISTPTNCDADSVFSSLNLIIYLNSFLV